ncbi:MAG TPA: hypothetical protein VFA54_10070 [Bryobacterales bacterium]|jgi:excinuclease ABC subunit C|nr:hypothetical protein [Bryobacterales bacterium]
MDESLACEIRPGGGWDLSPVPNVPGVFAVWPSQGPPYIGKSSLLRRRLARLLRPAETQSRLLNLAQIACRVEYQPAGSPFESMVLLYKLARRHRPGDYQKYLKLRIPPFLKINLSNAYPRCYVTHKLGQRRAFYFGPFPSRAAAERFQNAFLDLFQMRRCVEDLEPTPTHPGCIYGEMKMCLRPCQAAVTAAEYRSETERVVQFLATNGESLLKQLRDERDRASAALQFEQAARIHKKLERVAEALQLKDDLAGDLDRLHAIIIQRSVDPCAVELWLLYQGFLQPQRRLHVAAEAGQPLSLDSKLRETLSAVSWETGAARQRAEHLALVARWYASSWRQGEILRFEDFDHLPYRKLVKAISRVAAGSTQPAGARISGSYRPG